MKNLTAEIVRELIDYDKATGVVTWRWRDRRWFNRDRDWRRWNARYAGKESGSITPRGYRRTRILGTNCTISRLAYLHVVGKWPPEHIDHRDGCRDNNRWANLRPATFTQNMRNRRLHRNNTSGHKGVSFRKDNGKYRARINWCGTRKCLGDFSTAGEARAVYEAAAKKLFREFYRSPETVA